MAVSNPKFDPAPSEPESDVAVDISGDASSGPALPPDVTAYLGERLQSYYADLLNEPIPDRFIALIDQLKPKADKSDGH